MILAKLNLPLNHQINDIIIEISSVVKIRLIIVLLYINYTI